MINRGLDLGRVESTSDAEKSTFQRFYATMLGRSHPGLDFWLEPAPDVLKMYRAFSNASTPSSLEGDQSFIGFAFLEYYALLGYPEGVRYITYRWQQQGLSREQVLEGLALGFLHAGPRGMDTVAAALDGFEWIVPEAPAAFPPGWSPDPDAFHSGLDFSTEEMNIDEASSLRSWYLSRLGEVPPYVSYLIRHRPAALKAYRARFESCLTHLPKQVMPYSLLHYNVLRGFGDGIRENLLLAKGFGMTRDQALRAIYSALINAGVETISLVDRVGGDVFEDWA